MTFLGILLTILAAVLIGVLFSGNYLFCAIRFPMLTALFT